MLPEASRSRGSSDPSASASRGGSLWTPCASAFRGRGVLDELLVIQEAFDCGVFVLAQTPVEVLKLREVPLNPVSCRNLVGNCRLQTSDLISVSGKTKAGAGCSDRGVNRKTNGRLQNAGDEG